jgi:RNA polymerase sigma factor (sigma-70 family)
MKPNFSTNSKHDDQQVLLQRAVQLRTIKQIQQELALKTPSRTLPSQLVLARACGFGDDIYAYQDAITLGQAARDQLVTNNIGLVHYCVNDILKTRQRSLASLSREDLVQEGCFGLARAVDKWNLDIGGRFSTYAMYWVRAAIFRCIAEKDDVVRVPEHVSAAVRKVSRAAKRLGIEINGESILWSVSTPSPWKEAQAAKALAEEAGLTERQLVEAIKVRRRRDIGILSIDSWMQTGRDLYTDVAMHANRESDRECTDEREQLASTLSRFLRPKEMEALSWRYGLINEVQNKPAEPIDYLAEAEEALFGKPQQQAQAPELPVKGKQGEAMSFVEVGKKMQVSAEYTRRLVHTALDKLRRAADEGYLEPALIS